MLLGYEMIPRKLAGSRGELAAIEWRAHRTLSGATPGVLLIQPFAEEANKCRRMLASQARAFAGVGMRVLLIDPFGTGDSDGDFADATWAAWTDDYVTAARDLVASGCSELLVLGVRIGALLSQAVARAVPQVSQLVWWAPTVSGSNALTQFLRLRVAQSAFDGGAKVSTSDLRRELQSGRSVEVVGYEISPALGAELDRAAIDTQVSWRGGQLLWVDLPLHSTSVDPALRFIEPLRAAGVQVDRVNLPGEAFWGTVEIGSAPHWITHTTAWSRRARVAA